MSGVLSRFVSVTPTQTPLPRPPFETSTPTAETVAEGPGGEVDGHDLEGTESGGGVDYFGERLQPFESPRNPYSTRANAA